MILLLLAIGLSIAIIQLSRGKTERGNKTLLIVGILFGAWILIAVITGITL